MKSVKTLALVLACMLTAVLFAGCAGGGSDTIKIGFIGPLTGEVAQYGVAAQNAMNLYIDSLNEKGGIGGKKIELISYDDKGDATEAVNAYNKLVTSDEVVAILGAITSTPTIAVAQQSAVDNVPMMTPTATHADVTSYGNNTFRACFLDPFQGSTMAKFSVDELSAKTAAVIYNTSDAYSSGLRDSFIETAGEVGLEIVADEGYSKDDVDFKAQLTNIAAADPDVLFVPDYYNNVYIISSQSKEIGLRATLLGIDGADGVLAIEGADSANVEGLYFANHYSTEDPSELVQGFLSGYEEEFGQTPSALAALGYDGAMILCSALEKVAASGVKLESSDKVFQAVIDELDATDMDCVTGHITYDENNNPIKSLAIIKVEAGEYTLYMKY
ncbi:MAG: Leucine-, isoleucine-, valine-, threonine-, and alanine-binding protein precursor [Firmicutes bacterium ADurb.Bin182]|nr:MAG: Leucine-, isoleucine-, valine-, threonine-, and alanine-binding protein precursor [Firmicutes bacterium ADurb.Bin182]